MEGNMVRVRKFIETALIITKVNLRMVREMVLVLQPRLMVVHMRENGRMVKNTVSANAFL